MNFSKKKDAPIDFIIEGHPAGFPDPQKSTKIILLLRSGLIIFLRRRAHLTAIELFNSSIYFWKKKKSLEKGTLQFFTQRKDWSNMIVSGHWLQKRKKEARKLEPTHEASRKCSWSLHTTGISGITQSVSLLIEGVLAQMRRISADGARIQCRTRGQDGAAGPHGANRAHWAWFDAIPPFRPCSLTH